MNYNLLFEKAKAANISAIEVYESKPETLKLAVYEQNIDNFTTSSCLGIAIRGIYNHKLGSTYTEVDDDNEIDEIIKVIIENASAITSDEEVLFYDKIAEYSDLPLYSLALDEINTQDIIELLKSIETDLPKMDARITQVTDIIFEKENNHIRIKNSFGLDVERKVNIAYIMIGCMAKEKDDVQSHYDYQIFKNLTHFDKDKLLKDLSKELCEKLNATKIPSNKYPTIIRNKELASLINMLMDSFSAENVQKGLSLFENKLATPIFGNNVTLIEDPHLTKGYASTPFDDEGVPTKYKKIVENGILNTYFHNLKSAKKAQVEPTGNGFKANYTSNVNISATNFYLEAGTTSFNDLVKQIDKGAIINDISGLHAGINTLTLDFSLQAAGFYVENGAIIKPISLITIAGNLQTLFQEIDTIGNDLEFTISGVGAPSVLLKGLQITGE